MRRQALILALTLAAVLMTACKDGELDSVVAHPTNPDSVPTMDTRQVQTIISDNGMSRYRITTPRWLMFEEATKPHWIFPNGVQAEELDSALKPVTTIKCDSAYYDEQLRLWDLNRNVRITNAAGDVILTDQLFWNQANHELYSEAFIHIEKSGRVIEGYGYRSNEQFTNYTLRSVEAIFPVDESRMPNP